MTSSTADQIFITGIAGVLPKTKNVAELYENLNKKRQLFSSVDSDWKHVHENITLTAGKIPQRTKFDAGYFGIHYKQAQEMSLTCRKLLELSVEAIMDAGLNPADLKNTKTGVFVTSEEMDVCVEWQWRDLKSPNFGITGSTLAEQISYHLQLQGPSVVVDSACSSSMYALSRAVSDIKSGRCDNVLVCGGRTLQNPHLHFGFRQLGILDVNGHTNVFSNLCTGYTRSEGMMAMFIQTRKNSKKLYAEILNVKTTCDGFKNNAITSPSADMIAILIQETFREKDLDPATVEFVECHITGTSVGIVHEIKALKKSFCLNRKTPLPIGSVKANLGHCEAASGLASLFKILVGLQYNCILPVPEYGELPTKVNALMDGQISVVTERISLPKDRDVIIGSNNFGIGGTNGHAILKHHAVSFCETQSYSNRLVCFSARTMSSLVKIFESVKQNSSDSYLSLLQNVFRGFVIISKGEILEHSLQYCNDKQQLHIIYSEPNEKFAHSVVLTQIPLLAEKLEKIFKVLLIHGIDVNQLFNGPTRDFGDLVLITVVLQLALTDVLKALVQDEIKQFEGVSSGIIAKSYAKNTLTLEDALTLVSQLRDRLKKNQNEDLNDVATQLNQVTLRNNNEKKEIVSSNFVKLIVGFDNTNECVSFHSNLSFLSVLGRLYTMGFCLNLDKLYQNVSGPVKAPFISSLIEWKYEDDWDLIKYRPRSLHRQIVTIDLKDPQWTFLLGHAVDGRIIFPATAYIVLVWQWYAQVNRFSKNQLKVIFEDLLFHRATILAKEKPLILVLELTKVQNKFEITEGDDCVVSGKVRILSTDVNIPHPTINCCQTSMKTDDFYKKMKLHGYNYAGDFCCLQDVSVDEIAGCIKYNNWTTFLDGMLQLQVFSGLLDHLYIPVKIEQLVIDPQMHSEALIKYSNILPISFDQKSKTLVGPGVFIRKLLLSTTKKRKNRDPSLRIHKFVPFNTDLSLTDSVMIHVQIVTENLNNVLKAIEIVDPCSSPNAVLLCPLIHSALQSHFHVNSDLFIYSSSIYNYHNITVERKTVDQVPPDSNLVILSNASQRSSVVKKILQNPNCFVLSRESLQFQPFRDVETVSVHRTNSESLVLLRNFSDVDRCVVRVTSDFAWLTRLQSYLNGNRKVLLVAHDDNKSGILGLVNCLKQEIGQHVSCVFVPKTDGDFDITNEMYRSQLRKNLLFNVYKNDSWGSYIHAPLEENRTDCSHAICVTTPGSFSNVQYIQGSLTKKSSLLEHTLVHVYYAGVNFKDIVTATGRIDLAKSKQYRSNYESIGTEFAGKTSSNQRVFGMIKKHAFSNMLMANNSLMWKVPTEWSLEEAATVPTVYLTVLYSFVKVEQSILIHSGTGGIGQAAINIALHYKCNVFTTVGSPEKHEYLRKLHPSIPDSHIGNSRDISFERMILKQTKGKGVDVILNSLTEEKLLVSTRCLARNGTLLELGKYDALLNGPLPMETFADARSYVGIHVDEFFYEIPSVQKQIASLVERGLKEGYVKPLPRIVYEMDKIEDAFRFMSRGKHTGKILLRIKDESSRVDRTIKAKPRFYCDPEKMYVIIGGLGGFGIELADWLIGRNARKMILVSKRGITTGYQNYKLNVWKKLGCNVTVTRHDLTTDKGCSALLNEATAFGVVDGIFNLSVVLHDATIENQTADSFKTVLASKSVITHCMDNASRRLCPHLRHFVVFSSIVSGYGSSGQSNYGMANSISERICELRQSDGYPGLAIQWGVIGDVGLVAEKGVSVSGLDGVTEQKISSCLEVLDTLLTQKRSVVSSAVIDIKTTSKEKSKSEDFFKSIQKILALPTLKYVSMHAPLSTIGLDSTSTVQLRQFLKIEYNINLTLNELRSATLDMLMKKKDNITATIVD